MNDRSYIITNMGNVQKGVFIVGGGPTGITLAIEMARMGVPVRVIDKSSGPAQWSQALIVQARTLEQFERYGIAATAVAQGHPIRHAAMYHGGYRFVQVNLSRIHSRYAFALFLPQNETEALLLAHLRSLGVEVERNTELISFADEAGGGTATVRRAGGETETIPYRWLVGCDGAHSTVRHTLNIPFEGDSVGLRFFLGDLKLSGVDAPDEDLVIHLQDGNVLFLARLRSGITRVIVVQHSAQDDSGDRMPEMQDFQRWIDAYKLRIRVEDAVWRAPFHINQRKADRYRKGNVFLAGDASHIHSPVAGQGMNTGIQDTANLSWKLAAVAAGAPETLLDSYNAERGAVGDALLARTSQGLEVAATTSTFQALTRDLAGTVITHLPWVQDQIAGFIAETAIHYRDSSVVADLDGGEGLHAGDRVPNPLIRLVNGVDERLLAPLSEAKHLLITQGLTDPAATASRLRGAPAVHIAPGQSSEVTDLFGSQPGIWLVRPDGYLGFRGGPDSISALIEYARSVGIAVA